MKHSRSRRRSRDAAPVPSFDSHAAMLASQAFETLSLGLAELEDPALASLHIVDVAPGLSGDLVALVACPARDYEGASLALPRLEGRLRSELAYALQRKRVPLLRLALVSEEELALTQRDPFDDAEGSS